MLRLRSWPCLLAAHLGDLPVGRTRNCDEHRHGCELGYDLGVAVTFLTLVDAVGHSATFWIYAAITVCAWIFIYRLVPETKGKTLEQIEAEWQPAKRTIAA